MAAGLQPDRRATVRGPLPEDEFHRIFSRVPRLTVEVVIATPERGVLLALREIEPCRGLWHLPGGTVRFGEPLVDAVKRVAEDELGATVSVGPMLGYIEYPSHYENGLDSPVGLAFAAAVEGAFEQPDNCAWFAQVPDEIHDEQRQFLIEHRLVRDRGAAADEGAGRAG
ncbi:MAG: NUDIX domain-containing protein [Solirubrobacteraceae bacterium]